MWLIEQFLNKEIDDMLFALSPDLTKPGESPFLEGIRKKLLAGEVTVGELRGSADRKAPDSRPRDMAGNEISGLMVYYQP